MEKIKLYTHEEMLDRVVGEKGTSRRDAMEAELQSFLIGEAIKQARKEIGRASCRERVSWFV